jgi:PST family polysaccharide transporter
MAEPRSPRQAAVVDAPSPEPAVEEQTTPTASLRARSLSGALVLSVRQGLGMVLSLVGVLVLTRTLGPYDYGIYAVALGAATWLQTLADWGVNVYLVRFRGDRPVDIVEAQSFSLIMVMGLVGTVVSLALLPLVGHLLWSSRIIAVTAALVASTPIVLAAQVPLSRLDREMAYRKVATVELSSQLTLYLVAVPLVLTGAGPWAPAAGLIASRLALLVAAVLASRWRPRLYWERGLARDVFGYGFGYSASVTVWQLRGLAVPLIVAPVAGAAVAGQVALAIRLVEIAGFIRSATWRLALAALARVQHDTERTCRAVRDGAVLQTAAMGAILGFSALLAKPVLAAVFGHRWDAAAQVFPLIALGAVVNSTFNLHSSALYARRANWSVTRFHLVHVAAFLGFAFAAVGAWGPRGYGYAELAGMIGYLVLVRDFRQEIGSLDLAAVLPWLAAATGVLLTPVVGPVALLLLPAPLLPEPRRVGTSLVATTIGKLGKGASWRLA